MRPPMDLDAPASCDSPACAAALSRHWGRGFSLKPEQRGAVSAVLDGKDSLIVLSTGYGKSLCFQLPAVSHATGVTVVVTPLIALAQDQLRELGDRDICAELWPSRSKREAQEQIEADLAEDEPETRLLYITPEGLETDPLRQLLRRLHERGLLRALAVDEAQHCIASHNMREHSFAEGRMA